MGLLIIRLLNLLNTTSPDATYYHIARKLIEHFQQIHELSISQMAEIANVSKSTMSKFAKKIGFDDYYDLKDNAVFVEDCFDNRLNYLTNIVGVLENGGVELYFKAIHEDIDSLQKTIDQRAIDRLAQALITHQNVAAFGLMFSETAALDFQSKLAYNGKFIYTAQNDREQEQFVRDADEDTLIIAFTNSGNFISQNQLIPGRPQKNSFVNSKAKIIAITANPAVKELPYIQDAILFPHETSIQTHAFLYQIIMDLIVVRYRYFAKVSSLGTTN